MLERLAALLLDRRGALIIGMSVLTVASAVIASRLPYDFTPQALFSGEHELVAFNERVKSEFGHSENVILVVQTADGEDDLLTPVALRWQRRLCTALREIDSVEEVRALCTISMPRLRLLSRSVRRIPVVAAGPIDQQSAELTRRRVANQPILEGVLVSHDRRAAAIVLQLDPTRKDIAHVAQVIGEVRGAVQGAESPSGYDVFLGGLPAMRLDIIESLKRDQATIIPACVLVFAIVQVLIFRCWAGVVVPAMALIVGLAWTLAALTLLGQSLTIISNVLPILLMIVGVSTCVHFLNCYAERSVEFPHDRRLAVLSTVRQMSAACLLTSLTTALGFLSLLPARSELLRGFGWQAALGIAIFYIVTVLMCGTALSWFRPPDAKPGRAEASLLALIAWRLGSTASAHPKIVVCAVLVVLFVAAAMGRRVPVDSFLIETYDADHIEVRRMRLIEDQLAGFAPMEIILRSERPGWFVEASNWRRVQQFTQFSGTQENVLFARSYVDAFQHVDDLLPGGPPLIEVTNAELLQPRLDQIDGLLNRVAGDDQLRRLVSADRRTVRVALRLRDAGSKATLQLAASLNERLRGLFPPQSGVTSRITGESYVATVAINGFIRDLAASLLGVSALIFLVIGLLMRSVRLGLASILPNVAPLVVTLGYMGLRGYPLNIGNVIVFAISLGVAVDDTIHFLARFQDESRRAPAGGVTAAIKRTCMGTGRAVLMTTILIVCGQALLLSSAFVPTRRFAELTAVTMVAALLGDLILLPALLRLIWSDGTESQD